MGRHIALPRLHKFRLVGFQPILNQDINMTLGAGPNIILGGNGLGKTTIMQAVIYGMTGGNNIEEEEKHHRWNHSYFKSRLSSPNNAYVEVEFFLSKFKISIRRGFNGTHILAFHCDEISKDWVEKSHEATELFEQAIKKYGGYTKVSDFEFLVHRLLYLPETRRLLAWDANAQLRTIMSINQDVLKEEEFRKKRAHLKNLDSEKRHTHVAINKLKEQIEETKKPAKAKKGDEQKTSKSNITHIVDQLHEKNKVKTELSEKQHEIQLKLSSVSDELETIRNDLEIEEAKKISKLLNKQEKANFLVLHKLIERGLCPACGTHQSSLQNIAISYFDQHSCVICGADEPQAGDRGISTLMSQLNSKLQSQKSLENDYRITTNKLGVIREQEMVLQQKFNKIRSANLDVKLIERDLKVKIEKNPIRQKKNLESYEADLIGQIEELELELNHEYKKFHSAISKRMEQISEKYKGYATDFLGIDCELAESFNTEFIEYRTYVPKFNNVIRKTPESCSEAQRFFLDIAFRMAVIEYISESEDSNASFFCETPETALDLSYITNVVQMFKNFIKKNQSLLLTSNIQTDSIAKDLLASVRKSRRKEQVLNLLDIGDLSTVQKKARPKLNAAVNQIMG